MVGNILNTTRIVERAAREGQKQQQKLLSPLRAAGRMRGDSIARGWMAIAATSACTLGCVAKKHNSKEIKSAIQLCQSLHPKALLLAAGMCLCLSGDT